MQMRTPRIDSIQFLRGLAATMVAAFHLWAAADAAGYAPGVFELFKHGEAGVDIFFVISGFIIYYSVQGRRKLTALRFLRARFWRIVPPYWVILTLYVLAAIALGLVQQGQVVLPSSFRLVVSYLIWPYPDHVITIAWTLSIELLFYWLFALTYFRFGSRAFFAAMVAWVMATQVFLHAVPDKPVWLLLPLHSAVMEFLFGAIIAVVFLRGQTRFHLPVLLAGSALMLAYLTEHLALPLSREFLPGIPAAMIVYGVLGFRSRLPEGVILWGESSYVLYLGHILAYSVLGSLVRIATGFDVYSSPWAMAGMLAFAVAVSALATKYAEYPYQRWYRKRLRR